jgi:hypothetical protein
MIGNVVIVDIKRYKQILSKNFQWFCGFFRSVILRVVNNMYFIKILEKNFDKFEMKRFCYGVENYRGYMIFFNRSKQLEIF